MVVGAHTKRSDIVRGASMTNVMRRGSVMRAQDHAALHAHLGPAKRSSEVEFEEDAQLQKVAVGGNGANKRGSIFGSLTGVNAPPQDGANRTGSDAERAAITNYKKPAPVNRSTRNLSTERDPANDNVTFGGASTRSFAGQREERAMDSQVLPAPATGNGYNGKQDRDSLVHAGDANAARLAVPGPDGNNNNGDSTSRRDRSVLYRNHNYGGEGYVFAAYGEQQSQQNRGGVLQLGNGSVELLPLFYDKQGEPLYASELIEISVLREQEVHVQYPAFAQEDGKAVKRNRSKDSTASDKRHSKDSQGSKGARKNSKDKLKHVGGFNEFVDEILIEEYEDIVQVLGVDKAIMEFAAFFYKFIDRMRMMERIGDMENTVLKAITDFDSREQSKFLFGSDSPAAGAVGGINSATDSTKTGGSTLLESAGDHQPSGFAGQAAHASQAGGRQSVMTPADEGKKYIAAMEGLQKMVNKFMASKKFVWYKKLLFNPLLKIKEVVLESPLHTAVYKSNTEIVKTLLDCKADPTYTANPLAVALQRIQKMLLLEVKSNECSDYYNELFGKKSQRDDDDAPTPSVGAGKKGDLYSNGVNGGTSANGTTNGNGEKTSLPHTVHTNGDPPSPTQPQQDYVVINVGSSQDNVLENSGREHQEHSANVSASERSYRSSDERSDESSEDPHAAGVALIFDVDFTKIESLKMTPLRLAYEIGAAPEIIELLENAVAARAHEKAEAARIAMRSGGAGGQGHGADENNAFVSTQTTLAVGATRSKKAVVLKEEEKLAMLAVDTFSEASGIAWDSVYEFTTVCVLCNFPFKFRCWLFHAEKTQFFFF